MGYGTGVGHALRERLRKDCHEENTAPGTVGGSEGGVTGKLNASSSSETPLGDAGSGAARLPCPLLPARAREATRGPAALQPAHLQRPLRLQALVRLPDQAPLMSQRRAVRPARLPASEQLPQRGRVHSPSAAPAALHPP